MTLSLPLVLVITVVSALRSYEDDSARDEVLFLDDDDDALTRDEPTTPRRTIASRLVPDALMEVNETKPKCKNSNVGTLVKTGESLGEGAYGAVYKVQTKPGSKIRFWKKEEPVEFFALKVPHAGDADAIAAAEHETKVMKAVSEQNCDNVLALIEENPCVEGETQTHGILTRLAAWDLAKWKDHYIEEERERPPSKCGGRIYRAVQAGLDCMHAAGYAHGDVKAANILFDKMDDDGCPEGIQLADFGTSHKLGSIQGKFAQSFYDGGWNMPGTLFAGGPDPLGLTRTFTQGGETYEGYKVDTRLDDCATANLIWDLFRKKSRDLEERVGKGGCGLMGKGRKKALP